MIDPLELYDDFLDVVHESIWVVIMYDVHVDALASTRKECFIVATSFDASPYSGQDKCSWVYSLQIPSRHLKDNRVGRRHDSHDLCTTLDASASLVFLWLVLRYFEI